MPSKISRCTRRRYGIQLLVKLTDYILVKVSALTIAVSLSMAAASSFGITHTVQVVDFEFVPKDLVIAPGDTVTWVASAPDHTVTADDGSFDSSPLPTVIPIPVGTTFSHTFTATGVFPYYCRLHGQPISSQPSTAHSAPMIGPVHSVPDDVMMGSIRVADPSANAAPETPRNSFPVDEAAGQSSSPLLQATAYIDADIDDRHASSQWLVRQVPGGELILDTLEDATNLTQLRIENLAPSVTYEWQVRYRDDRGAWSEYSTATRFTVASSIGEGSGLVGTYFAYNAKLDVITRQVGTRLDAIIDFDWALGKPHPSAPANNFFIYWEGMVVPEFSEEYLIRARADGGVRIWINGQMIIDDAVATTFALYRSGKVNLEAGIPASIRIQYFDTIARASIQLRWSSLSTPLQVIPKARLFPFR